MESIPTGVPGLDRVLRGGLVSKSLHVFGGLPGTGKTSLAQQISYHHAKNGGMVLYLAALSETADRLVGHASSFGFFDPAMVAQRIYYVSVYPKLEEGGLSSVLDEIRRLCMEHRISLVCLDGLPALKSFAPSPLEFRRFVFDLNTQLRTLGATSILLGHWDLEMAGEAEFTVADGIIALSLESSIEGAVRYLEVLKLRGADNLPGPHPFTISENGVAVYPRLEAASIAEGIEQPPGEWTKVTTGTSDLDAMLQGGVPSGSITLITGASGVGKTTLALSFLAHAAPERGLYVGLGEAPSRLLARADALGLGLRNWVDQGTVQMVWIPPIDLIPDRIAWQLLDLLDSGNVHRLVIDGIDRLSAPVAREGRSQPFLAALMAALRSRGVTTLMTHELAEIEPSSLGSPFHDVGAAADNLIVLQYSEIDAMLHRQMSILKVRESDFDPVVREFTIATGGVSVAGTGPIEKASMGDAEGQGGRHAQ